LKTQRIRYNYYFKKEADKEYYAVFFKFTLFMLLLFIYLLA
jgi:hypothetical protein